MMTSEAKGMNVQGSLEREQEKERVSSQIDCFRKVPK